MVENNTLNTIVNNMNEIKQALKANNYLVNMFVILFITFLVIVLVFYIRTQINKKEENCSYIKKQYNDGTSITNVDYRRDDYNNFFLNEYYILSAYNCCCSGNNKNDYVDLCALDNCISQGARFLDFQIYNKNDEPVVASSSDTSFKYKETYNYLNINDVLKRINGIAFTSGSCPNFEDPLILNFRMFSKEKSIYDKLGNAISKDLSDKLLPGVNYGNESDGVNIFNKELINFRGKIIIIVHVDNEEIFEKSKLKEYTNITSGPNKPFIQQMNSFSVNASQNYNDLIQYNRMNSTIVVPNLNSSNINYDPSTSIATGCQFICMNFQNKDNYLKYLLEKFNNVNSAFLLKPENLRPVVEVVKPGIEIPEEASCKPQPRTVTVGNEEITLNI